MIAQAKARTATLVRPLAAIATLFAIAAPSASAAEPHNFLGNFGSVAAGGTGSEPSFPEPAGMAVDQASGDLLVINFTSEASGTIERFKPDGTPDPFSALGTNVIDGKRTGASNECPAVPADCDETVGDEGILSNELSPIEVQIAVDNSSSPAAGNIYATDAEHGLVDVFSPTGEFLAGKNGLGGSYACGVAVAPNGDLFIGDYSANKVFKFEPTSSSTFTQTGAFTTTHPCQVAANEGFVFAAEFEGSVTKIDSEGAEEGTTSTVDSSDQYTTLNVDPFDEHLYGGTGTKVNEFNVSGPTATLIEPSIEPGSITTGVAIDESSGNVFVSRFGNTKIKVYGPRTPRSYKLTVSKSGTGTGTVKGGSPAEPSTINCGSGAGCEHEYLSGAVVTLTHEATAGSEFKEWTGACSGSGSCEVTMSAVKSVGAKFDLEPVSKFKLTVSKSGTGTGTVKGGSPAEPSTINCGSGAGCEHEYLSGAVVTLTHEASAGSEFVKWTGACVGSGTCEVTMSAAKSVGAEFKLSAKPKFKLTVSKSGTGTGTVTSVAPNTGIACGATCSAEFEEGKQVELSQAADSGSEFKEWTGACTGSGSCKITMSAAKSVGAVFNAKSSGGGGGGTGGGGAAGGGGGTPPAEEKCIAPKLAKKTLGQAKSALRAAHCALGKVTKPKKAKGALVVKSSSPGAGTTLAAGAKVNLKLGPKPKRKH